MAEKQKMKPYDPEVFQYIRNKAYRPHPLKEALRTETEQLYPTQANMTTQSFQGEFMQMTVRAMGAKKCLEVGVFTGYSSLCVALGLPDDGKLYALDTSEEWTNIAKKYWEQAGVSHKVELILGPGVDTLQTLINEGHTGTFDFCFIDADKLNYQNYYEMSLQLLRQHGMMILDNVLWSGKVADESVQDEVTVNFRRLTEMINGDERVQACILPFSDGIYQILKLKS